MKRNELLKYVESLDVDLQRVFHIADEAVLVVWDTLGEDFQVASQILTVFETRAEQFSASKS